MRDLLLFRKESALHDGSVGKGDLVSIVIDGAQIVDGSRFTVFGEVPGGAFGDEDIRIGGIGHASFSVGDDMNRAGPGGGFGQVYVHVGDGIDQDISCEVLFLEDELYMAAVAACFAPAESTVVA